MAHYEVGGHEIVVWERRKRWSVTVDRVPVPGWFPNEAEAWSAGVRVALRERGAHPGGALQDAQ